MALANGSSMRSSSLIVPALLLGLVTPVEAAKTVGGRCLDPQVVTAPLPAVRR